MLRAIGLVIFTLAVVHAFPATTTQEDEPGVLEQGIEATYRFLQDCGDKPMSLCVKMRALTMVDRALKRSDDVEITEGVSLVSENTVQSSREANARALSEDELDATLPQNPEERETQVESLLVDRVARYLSSHTLQLKVPDEALTTVRQTLDEGIYSQPKKPIISQQKSP